MNLTGEGRDIYNPGMILALDTATRVVSLALHDGGQVVAEHTWRSNNHHTIEVTPMLEQMLVSTNITPLDLSAIAVALGPGSYTGLRIGMSIAKGLALSVSPALPLIAIPTLDVVAAAQPHQCEQLVAVAQAGRGRINAGLYQWSESGWQAVADTQLVRWEALIGQLKRPTLVAGEINEEGRQYLQQVNEVVIAVPELNLRRASILAGLAFKRLVAGEVDSPVTIAPVYSG
jgi:tRNA threonylcarbamoyladenosine biosynthesis protein TsaB